jgi:hypothetical protein
MQVFKSSYCVCKPQYSAAVASFQLTVRAHSPNKQSAIRKAGPREGPAVQKNRQYYSEKRTKSACFGEKILRDSALHKLASTTQSFSL